MGEIFCRSVGSEHGTVRETSCRIFNQLYTNVVRYMYDTPKISFEKFHRFFFLTAKFVKVYFPQKFSTIQYQAVVSASALLMHMCSINIILYYFVL